MKVVVVGGGGGGLFASLLLARAGHEVTLLEQDETDPPDDLETAAATAFRQSAPQIVQPHIVMARCRQLLRQHLPDVYEALVAHGVRDVPLADQMPASLADRTPRPGDDDLATLMTRRSTLDWVLQRAAASQPGVTIERGARVVGLRAAGNPVPRVTAVRTETREVPADVVVDATGRRTPIDRWLEEIGAPPAARASAECGVAYFSRHYRLRRGAELPGLPTTRLVAGLDEFTIAVFGADNDTMQLAVVPLATDRRFRAVTDPSVFTAVLRTVPAAAPWLDVMEPITPVFQMTGPRNSLRRLTVDGAPVVTGLHAIGDSVCTTNPTLGRGLSLAMWGAVDLVDVLAAHPDDPVAQAVTLGERVADHVEPFYVEQAAVDQARLALLRYNISGGAAPDTGGAGDADAERITFAQLRVAALFDPIVFRAFWRIMGMLCRPDDVYTDAEVVARTRAVLAERGTGPPIAQPTRQELLAALATPPGEPPVSTPPVSTGAAPRGARSRPPSPG